MKRFILSVLCVSVFFVGLGALVDKAGARFRSDEKALELVRKARIAIGGDAAINNIQSLRIVGQSTRNSTVAGNATSETGETEIAMQFPDKLMRTMKFRHGEGAEGQNEQMRKQMDVVVVNSANAEDHSGIKIVGDSGDGQTVHKILVKKGDGTTTELTGADAQKFRVQKVDGDKTVFTTDDTNVSADGDKKVFIRRAEGPGEFTLHTGIRHNEMLRLTLGLLMTSPKGIDVDYQLGGESNVDGTPCNIVVANFGGSSYKIYLSSSSNLPVMMSYTGTKMPVMVKFRSTGDSTNTGDEKNHVILERGVKESADQSAEYTVKFSDYRSVDGVQLPYVWTQTIGGSPDETFAVTSYEINPANIADKFKGDRVMYKVKKPDNQ